MRNWLDKILDKTEDYLTPVNVASWGVFFLSMFVYCDTVDTSASYWDCPEYIVCGSRLEVGHPPGNPVWMLVMRVLTALFPLSMHAVVINLSSSLFMALAAFFLARIIYILSMYVAVAAEWPLNDVRTRYYSAGAAFAGGACFAFCDSAWFSAVEAEVYAMSAFLTGLTLWLMLKWAELPRGSRRDRLLILLAYLMGLSLGVHQLNLLCIPVFALIFIFRENPGRKCLWKGLAAIMVSFLIVAAILLGMPGLLTLAQKSELFAVNSLGMPYSSGVLAFAALLFLCFAAMLLWLPRRVKTAVWMAGFIVLGYSSFALILIRGMAAPPMNEGAPSDIFALASYISRDQYGSTPLFHGSTPLSRPVFEETWREGDNRPSYSRYALKKGKGLYVPSLPGARLNHRSRFLSAADSAMNNKVTARRADGYILSDYAFTRVMTPELDMYFPRITAPGLDAYGDWTGMSQENMTRLRVSEAMDSAGNFVDKMGADGQREESYSYRPTYLQNLKMFLSYQVGYMYFRYLMWNFVGRQNDYPSTGEIEHGNFITGFPALDNAMLGDQSKLPGYAGKGNAGRNVYYGIPFAIALLGIIRLYRGYRMGRRTLAVVTLFFLMTGLAIVVYLNQSPGEPRERDYSFLGSYMAFCIWIGFGIYWILASALRRIHDDILHVVCIQLISLVLPVFMMMVNYDDHIRTGRHEASDFARNVLRMDAPSIIFSQGDNFTFPLWYVQEVEQFGKHHTVVDVSYLSTPGYVVNLMKQGKDAIRFTARPEDVAYGAYAFTSVATDADTLAVPLIEALRELYSSRSGTPQFRHSKVFIPGIAEADTVTLDLRNLAAPSGLITFRKLMLLDILASNLEGDSPKFLYFLSSVGSDFHKWLAPALRQALYGKIYSPGKCGSAPTLADEVSQSIADMNSSGELELYADPLILERKRRERGEITAALLELVKDKKNLSLVMRSVVTLDKVYPYQEIPAGSFTLADTTFHEGEAFGKLMLECVRISPDARYRWLAGRHADYLVEQAHGWKDYYLSLSSGQRGVVGNETRRIVGSVKRREEFRKKVKIVSDSMFKRIRDRYILINCNSYTRR